MLLTSIARIPGSEKPTGVWIEELTDPYYAFREFGMHIAFCSTRGGAVPIDPDSWQPDGRTNPSIQRYRTDPMLQSALSDVPAIADVSTEEFDLLYIPGGHGTMWDLPNNADVSRSIRRFLQRQRPVAAVCHGPAAFIGAESATGDDLLDGLEVTAFSAEEEHFAGLMSSIPFLLSEAFVAAGAHYRAAPAFQPCAVRDNLLISGQNPQSSANVIALAVEAIEAI